MRVDLAITGIGMVCSVGHDVATGCAAIRAGMTRPRPLPWFEVATEDEFTVEPGRLIGLPIRGFTEGFHLVGLWVRTAVGCVQDLLRQRSADGDRRAERLDGPRTAVVLALPDLGPNRCPGSVYSPPETYQQDFLAPLIELLRLSIPLELQSVVLAGHTGALEAAERAAELILAGSADRALVIAVDSYLDPGTLSWLAGSGRLKTDATPMGLIPGEAGACFLLESRVSAERSGAPIRGWFESVAISDDPEQSPWKQPSQGASLAEAVWSALGDSPRAGSSVFHGDLVVDLNGEQWRAYEYGTCRTRLASDLDPECTTMVPAVSLGDVGTASAAVAVCTIIRSFERGYSHSDASLILSSSESGHRGAAVLSGAG
jgi:3-oxoacyl-[acyl-carrier-protein] synthase-1